MISSTEAARIILDPYVYDRITDDYCPKPEDYVMPDIPYYGGFLNGKLVSVFVYWGENPHFQILKSYRMHAREFAKMFIDISPKPMIAAVPSLYRTYINFLKKLGFTLLSIDKNNYTKNGKTYDTHRLILCRS